MLPHPSCPTLVACPQVTRRCTWEPRSNMHLWCMHCCWLGRSTAPRTRRAGERLSGCTCWRCRCGCSCYLSATITPLLTPLLPLPCATPAVAALTSPLHRTPLHCAAAFGSTQCIDLLTEAGAAVDEPAFDGRWVLGDRCEAAAKAAACCRVGQAVALWCSTAAGQFARTLLVSSSCCDAAARVSRCYPCNAPPDTDLP